MNRRTGDRLGICTSCGWQAWRIPHSGGYAPCPKCRHALAFDAEHWQKMSHAPIPHHLTEE